MDNRSIDLTSEGHEALSLALKLMWDSVPGGFATHFKIVKLRATNVYWGNPTSHHEVRLEPDDTGVPTLILFWTAASGAEQFAYPHDLERTNEFVKGWLKSVEYGPEPDHDGDNGKGWRVFTDFWGQIAGASSSIVGIQPAWAMYGK